MDVREKSSNEKRLIDANALIDEFLKQYTERERDGNLVFTACEIKQDFADMISNIPTVDAVEVVHGRWVDNGACGYKWAFSCSKCGYIDGYPFNDRHNYCPNCGAKMDKSTD